MKIKKGVLIRVDDKDIKDGKIKFLKMKKIKALGYNVFSGYNNLSSIEIPEGVTSIGNSAFAGCSSLTSIDIPEGVTNIGDFVFERCYSLTSITIPEGVTSIGNCAFEGCSSLASLKLPEGITSIGNSLFNGCNSLTSITIPQRVTNIGYSAFAGCSSLTSIDIPEYVTKIGDSVFSGCSGLTGIDIPEGVTNIGDFVFSGCSGLTSIDIPEGVTNIGEEAFYECSSLTNINIPKIVTSIGGGAFYGCSSLKSINVPEGVTKIDDSVFSECSSLASLKLPEGITSIGNSAFNGCNSLISINIPQRVTNIGNSAFNGCSNLTSIDIPESVTNIGDFVFRGCSGLASINIPKGVTSIGNSAFSGCSGLKEINIPDGVASIGNNAFSGCSGLKEINIPEGVTSIGNSAFSGCSGLTEINIPEGVTSIGKYAFTCCSGLTEINIPEGVTNIGDFVFSGCSGLKEINIPEGVASIGKYAFAGCSGLKEINIPEGVTSIEDSAFYGCHSVKKVTGKVIQGMEKKLYFTSFPNAENLYTFVYGEDAERFKALREKASIEKSANYDPYIMAKIYNNMHKTMGIDAMERILDISKLNQQDVANYYRETDAVYQKYFEKRYELGGSIGNTALLLQNIATYLKGNKKEQQSILQALNQSVDEEEIYTLKDLLERIEQTNEISQEVRQKIEEKSNEINSRIIEENLAKCDETISQIYAELNLANEIESFSKRLIQDVIKEEFKKNGRVTLEQVIERIEETEINVPAINEKRQQIKEVAIRLFGEREDTINHNVIDEIRDAKEKVGQGWIRKLLQLNTNVRAEELDNVVAKINSPNITAEDLIRESTVIIGIKDGIDKDEVYKELEGKQIAGVVTYNQLEQMFGGIREPYSEEFKKWFSKHQQEILSNPKYYLNLSKMHNNFETTIHREEFEERYEREGISVEHLNRIVAELKHDGELPGEEEMSDKFDLAGVDPAYYPKAQSLFKEMKERESTPIPQIEVVKSQRYRGRIRRMDDPSVIFDGDNTGNCQRFGHVGEPSMLDAARKGGIFIVEKLREDGTYSEVGESWVWRNKDRLCFDNIELPDDIEDAMTKEEYDDFMSVYEQAAKAMIALDDEFLQRQVDSGKISKSTCERYRLKEVTVGMGYVNNTRLKAAIRRYIKR